MRGTRLPALALIVGLVAVSVAVAVVIDPMGAPTSSQGQATSASPGPRASDALETGYLQVEAFGAGPGFPVEPTSAPTGLVAQSKLWFHDGAWWGVLVADGTEEFRIHRFDWAGQRWLDTGTRVAPRASDHPDVLAEGDQVWVATSGGQPTPRRLAALVRFTYDPDSARYVPDPDFPVTIAEQRARSLTLARDDAGRLWAAWMTEDGLVVSHTDGNDWIWGEPQAPPVPGADAATAAVAIISYGDTVALVWTNQDVDAVSVAIPSVDDPQDWAHIGVAVEGLRPSGDDINVTVLETDAGPRLFAAVRTSLDADPNSSPGDPKVVLLVVEPDGSSRQYLVGRVEDNHTRPIVLLDGENEVIYVVATLSGGDGAIYYKASALDDISFLTGVGTPLIEVDELGALNSATSTKQTLDSGTGLLVLASDIEAGSHAWAVGRLPGPGSPNLDAITEFAPGDDPLLFDTFDPFPPGSALDPMWVPRSEGGASFAIADTADGRRAATASAPDGSSVRICREILPVGDGEYASRLR